MRSLSVKLLGSIAALAITVAASEASADTTFYTSESAFDAAIGTSITDTYDSPGYASFSGGGVSDAKMNKVFGETRYTTTGFKFDTNFVGRNWIASTAARIVRGAMARLFWISVTRLLVLPKAFTGSALIS